MHLSISKYKCCGCVRVTASRTRSARGAKTPAKKGAKQLVLSDDDDFETGDFLHPTQRDKGGGRTTRTKTRHRAKPIFSSSDDDDGASDADDIKGTSRYTIWW